MIENYISEADVSQLIKDVAEYKKYSVLMGAGTSKPAGIPTGNELIERWQKEHYEQIESDDEFDNWVEHNEDNEMGNKQSEYGFWFEQRYPMRVHRRDYIQKLVEGTDPTLSHLLLATMMSDGYIPHVLTPNFDDLLFDAFYLYLEDKPNLIDHRTVAPEFKLTRDDSAIVKLHGDYLYDNLKNIDSETKALEPAMKEVLQQTVSEYGLVVIGYSGDDESIMEPLLNADLSEYGIYWCVLSSDDLKPDVKKLLEKPNVYLVEIEGFGSLMAKFEEELPDIKLPAPEEVIERAEQQAEKLRGTLSKGEESVSDEEEELRDRTEKRWTAIHEIQNGNYSEAIDILNRVIESYPENSNVYSARASAKFKLNQNQDAIEDFDRAIELDPKNEGIYTNRAIAKTKVGQYEDAINDCNKAIELEPKNESAYNTRANSKAKLGRYEDAIEDCSKVLEFNPRNVIALQNRAEIRLLTGEFELAKKDAIESKTHSTSIEDQAESLLLELIAKIVLGENIDAEEELYKNLCEEELDTSWGFTGLDRWVEDIDINSSKREKIEEYMDSLREHKSDS